MNTQDPFYLDKHKMRHAFDQAAAMYEEIAVLQKEVGNRLVERLDYIRMVPENILDLGAGCGNISNALVQRYAGANVLALDIAENMLQTARLHTASGKITYLCGDMESVPIASGSFDLLLSNLTLQWCNDVMGVFQEFTRLLKPGGLVMFTTFGLDTLQELRTSWSEVDDYTHVNGFIDMHNIGDALLEAGLAEPVMDSEIFTLTYPTMDKLMDDLKGMGAHNVTAGRPRGLTGKSKWQQVEKNYEKFRSDGVLPATYEVIYGHAWAPVTPKPGQAEIPIEQIK